ncbi:uncharacterized protein RJT21DRAFT_113168 [Scheffersomyces amazonensis]|uniref:uncharacterized protein n=1 Tax=Scheffersomyces amazonensis TaxID=1078765 RepID=UPI00315D785A
MKMRLKEGSDFIKNNYEFVTILSGESFGETYGCDIKIKEKASGKFFLLKIYDILRSRAYKASHMDANASFSFVTRLFNKEVASSTRLEKLNNFPQVFYYGYFNGKTNVYQEELDDSSLADMPFIGYFIIEEFF